MKEAEALEKWCPMARSSGVDFASNRYGNGHFSESDKCIASRCMMWRWETEMKVDAKTSLCLEQSSTTKGYCGLASKERD